MIYIIELVLHQKRYSDRLAEGSILPIKTSLHPCGLPLLPPYNEFKPLYPSLFLQGP